MKYLVLLGALSLSQIAYTAQEKVLYGEDNRSEVSEYSDNRFIELSQSIAGKVPKERLRLGKAFSDSTCDSSVYRDIFDDLSGLFGDDSDFQSSLFDTLGCTQVDEVDENFYYFDLDRTLKNKYEVCEEEPYSNQITLPNCSGFLIAPDLIMTAGHCIKKKEACTDSYWVFGYTNDVKKIPKENVYSCKEVVNQKFRNGLFSKKDYSIIRLDRPVADRTPLELRMKGKVKKGTELTVIGHPVGLPMKITDGATINRVKGSFFFANLDTYAGNSGSPVLNSKTGIVEGILVSGQRDFLDNGFCRYSNKLSDEMGAERSYRIPKIKDLDDILGL